MGRKIRKSVRETVVCSKWEEGVDVRSAASSHITFFRNRQGPRQTLHWIETALPVPRFAAFGLLAGITILALAMPPTRADEPSRNPAAGGTPTAAPSAATPPPFAKIEQVVQQYVKGQPDFRMTDLLTRDQAEAILAKVEKAGLPLRDRKQILERVPAKDEFFVRELSTPDGRRFVRAIANLPQGFDRVDRLCRMPVGEQTVHDLVKGPGGEKMIEYMTKAQGGVAMGQMLSDTPQGTDFNTPTGRIYTPAQLLEQLKKSYTAIEKGAAKPAPQKTRPTPPGPR
jgi:hypothetical protein